MESETSITDKTSVAGITARHVCGRAFPARMQQSTMAGRFAVKGAAKFGIHVILYIAGVDATQQ